LGLRNLSKLDKFDRIVAWFLTAFCVLGVSALEINYWHVNHWYDNLMVIFTAIAMIRWIWIAKNGGVLH